MLSGWSRRTRRRAMGVALVALAATTACACVWAQETSVIYRCTDAKGEVTFQNGTPCPKGSQEVKRSVGSAPATTTAPPWVTSASPAPRPTPPAPSVAPPATSLSPTPVPASATASDRDPALRPLPPPLFACRVWDNSTYLGDEAQPAPRCTPLQITGLDGSAGVAGGSACQMVEDVCEPVPEASLCERWNERVHDVATEATFGSGDKRVAAQAQLERLRAIVRESRCTR